MEFHKQVAVDVVLDDDEDDSVATYSETVLVDSFSDSATARKEYLKTVSKSIWDSYATVTIWF